MWLANKVGDRQRKTEPIVWMKNVERANNTIENKECCLDSTEESAHVLDVGPFVWSIRLIYVVCVVRFETLLID